MKKYLVATYPLSYRITEPIMNSAFKILNFDGIFDSKEVPAEALEKEIQRLRSGELQGLSVFTPHKGPSIAFCDEVSEEAKIIGAINYIQAENGILKAYNLDFEGAMRAMKIFIPSLDGKKILILGAGGAGRALSLYAKKAGALIHLWDPKNTEDKLSNLVQEDFFPEIIINATRLSAQDRQQSILPFELWSKVELVMESVCRSTSLFLEEAKAMQVPYIIEGEDWASHQMNALLKHITSKELPDEEMHKIVREVLKLN